MGDRYICHLCGYPELDEAPWGHDGNICSFNICPCCACEFGIDDLNEEMLLFYKDEWLNGGMKWFIPDKKPLGWDFEEQKKNILQIPKNLLPYYLNSK